MSDASCTIPTPWCKASKSLRKESPYRVEVYNTINDIRPYVWEQIVPAEKTFLGIDYLSAFEKSIEGNIEFRYLILYKNNQAAGIVVSQIMSFDGANIGLQEGEEQASFFKKLLTRIVNRFSLRILVVGNAFMTGEYAVCFCNKGMDDEEKFELLNHGLQVLVRQEKKNKRLSGVVIKDFFVGNEGPLKHFVDKGYLQITVQPDMILPIDESWHKFDDYLGAMSSKYRVRARQAIKKIQEIEARYMSLEEIEQQFPVMEGLYNQIIGSASFKLAKFDLRHIPVLKRSMGDKFCCLGFYSDQQLVGFISMYENEQGELVAGMMGMDKGLLRSHDLYLNILYCITRCAIERGSTKLVMGRTAMEIKSSLGAEPHDMYIYVRHLSSPVNWVIKPVIRMLTRTPAWHQRTPFKA